MLGVMDNKMAAVSEPSDDTTLMKSPQGASKVKSTTIDMFFKSPPKQQAPKVKSPTLLGYFKPTTDGSSRKLHNGCVNSEPNKEDVKSGSEVQNGHKKALDSQAKKTSDKKTNKISEPKKSNKDKKTSKKDKICTSGHTKVKDAGKSTKNALKKNKGATAKLKMSDIANESLDDFETSTPGTKPATPSVDKAKPQKTKRTKSKQAKPHKPSEKKLDINPKEENVRMSVGNSDVKTTKSDTNVSLPVQQSSSISYGAFLEDEEEKKEDVGKEKTDAGDANSSVVISYLDFLHQSSGEEEEDDDEEGDKSGPVRNDNEASQLSRELSDVDMVDTVTTGTDESEEVSMETGNTSDEDVFQDDDDDVRVNGSSNDEVLTISLDNKQKKQQLEQTKQEEILTQPDTNEKEDDELCLPKKKEVTVTAQVHTPPILTPSASPSHSPSTSKRKSNVVVDASDMDLEIIHVEETDVHKKDEAKNVFSYSGSTTPKRDAGSGVSVKPAPKKLYSIFQKKGSVKEESHFVKKDEDGNVDKDEKVAEKVTNEGSEHEVKSNKKPNSKKILSESKSADAKEATGKEKKQKVDKSDSQTEVKDKRRLSLNKDKKNEEKKKEETPRRQSSGRAAAIKARKDIIEQELKREMVASDSATSQEDIPPPKKKTLKDLFPSGTDTDASEREDTKKATKRKSDAGEDIPKRKQGRPRRNSSVGQAKNDQSDFADTPAKAKRKGFQVKDDEVKTTPGKRKRGLVVTSTPKPDTAKKTAKKAKAQELLQKAKRRSSSRVSPEKVKKTSPTKLKKSLPSKSKKATHAKKATPLKSKKATPLKGKKATPSKAKKSRIKSDDSVVEILDSSTEDGRVVKTKPLRNFKDVLGKVVAKEPEGNKKKKGKEVDLNKKKKGAEKADKKQEESDGTKSKQEKSSVVRRKTEKAEDKKKMDNPAPHKAPTKLCPLFTKEGRLAAAKRQAEMIEANSQEASQDTLIVLSDEDSNDTRLSQGGRTPSTPLTFSKALSAVRQRDQEKKVLEMPYPAFPTVSHVLQKGDTDSQLWNLSSVNLPLRIQETMSWQADTSMLTNLALGMVTMCDGVETKHEFTSQKVFNGHPELSCDTRKVLLEDISKSNPKVQVKKLFKRYLAKRKGDPLPANKPSDKANDKGSDKFTKLKSGQASGKRKSEAILDDNEENGRRKRSRQDKTDGGPRRRSRSKPDETKELRRSTRRSTQSKEEVKGQNKSEVKGEDRKSSSGVKEKDEATLKAEKLASMTWTEKYQPTCSAEVMGNTACVKKLSGWLDEWRKKFLKEKKKLKKQQRKGGAKKSTDQFLADSDSDFDMSDDYSDSDSDYSDEEDFLCNTMMISGPNGAGKTAAVYACAQEHGFKVFEVNASSKRVGRQILSDLGEATQSHHVAAKPGAKTGINSFFTPGPKMSPGKSPRKSPRRKKAADQKKKPPIPKAFANFFKVAAADKKTAKDAPKSKPKAKSGKQKGKEEPPPAVTMVTKKKTDVIAEKTMPSASIILFEEVDVVFEEDKGFLAAIASFMETTKRPIILTTSDPQFAYNFEGKYESLIFRRPSQTLLATHLQLVALAENVFTNPTDMQLVAQHLDCDIRHSVSALQYWITSGAKPTKDGHVAMETNSVSRTNLNDNNCRTDNSVKKCNDIESKLNLIGEYYTCLKGRDPDGNASKGRDPSLMERYEEMLQDEIMRHDSCLECIMGVCNQTAMDNSMVGALQVPETVSTLSSRSSVAETYQHQTQSELTYNNFHHLLQCPTGMLPKTTSSLSNSPNLGKKLVSITAKYLDHLSSMDAAYPLVHDGMPPFGCHSNQGWWQANLKASMLDIPGEDEDNASHHEKVLHSKIRSSLEVLSFGACRRKYEKLLKDVDTSGDKGGMEEGVSGKELSSDESDKETTDGSIDILPRRENFDKLRLRAQETKCPDVYPVLLERLPNHIYCSHQSITCDYLPMVRQICRSERWRQEAALKRRFLHYLDYSGIGLKATDYIKLASALDVQPKKPPQEDSFLSAI